MTTLCRALVFLFLVTGPSRALAADGDGATVLYEKLRGLHAAKTKPGSSDWLAVHSEPGQTFEEYAASNPARPDKTRRTIYVTLMGDFNDTQEAIIRQTARYMEAYFQMPVKFVDPVPLSSIPAEARRIHPVTGDRQVLSPYVIEDVLKPRLPKDAFCFIAFTSSDLWPGEGWNFVFGQASLEGRVGVWSIYRNGDPRKGRAAYRQCLRRTLKTGTHEIGHMFGLYHCVYHECNMNGSNHRKESDRRPLWLCPVCLKKLAWSIGFDPAKRYQQLAEISGEFGLEEERAFFLKSLEALRGQ
ncbi:MAG: archaemetzincin [Candidatus Omnitrophota bacterium]|nr:archaemetzincin [Candidatus Omnitrophota bacterium]MDZ4242348.1 archaemetzincin [Candidatus Omnitrophota bacterium]